MERPFDWSIDSVTGIPSTQAMCYTSISPDGRVIMWTNQLGPPAARGSPAGIHERAVQNAPLVQVILTDGSVVEFQVTHTVRHRGSRRL